MSTTGRHLYVIGDGTGHVKIGRSNDPKDRMRKFQTGCPRKLSLLYVEQDAGHLEPRLHEHFASLNTHLEWFDFTGTNPVAAVLAALDTMRERDQVAAEIRAKYEDKLAAAREEAARWRARFEEANRQIETERATFATERRIFAMERQMNELAWYAQTAVAEAGDKLATELLHLVVGSTKEEIDATVAEAIKLSADKVAA